MTPEGTPITEEAANAFFNYLQNTQTDTNWFGPSPSASLGSSLLSLR